MNRLKSENSTTQLAWRMNSLRIVLAIALLTVHLQSSDRLIRLDQAIENQFEDPAPPKVHRPRQIKSLIPSAHPDVIFHREPTPLSPAATINDWESFLGPNHNAISNETKLRKSWPMTGPPLVWEMTRGSGYSSPAISNGKLVYFHRLGDEEIIECLDQETGRRFWRFAYPANYEDRYGYSNGPRTAPVIANGRVYTYGVQGHLHCLKLDTGQLYWRRNLLTEFNVPQGFFGVASTPLIEGDLLIIVLGAPGGPTVAAFKTDTGELIWGAGTEWGAGYASPIPATIQGKRRIFIFTGGESKPPTGGLIVLDPQNGAIDFTFPWRSRSYESVNASSPVIIGNQVFLSATYRLGSVLLNISPDIKPSVAWMTKEVGLHWNTAVYKDDYLYAYDGRNESDASIVCIEAKTGRVMWRKTPEWLETVEHRGRERTFSASTLRASLLWADGAFIALGELGHLLRLELTPESYKEVSRSWLFSARQTWGLPVLSRGLLYVSQNERSFLGQKPPRLMCYDLRAQK